MPKVAWLTICLLMPFRAAAWEDDNVLSFISQANPIIQAQHNVSRAYAKPDSVTWALQNTSLSGRLGYGGLQISIPLSSIKEDREQALKLVAEAKETEDMHTKVIMDIAQLRTLEAELAASEVRRKFLKEKAAWLKDRIDKGYSSEMDQLWDIGSKLNTEDALIAKVEVLANTQRYKLAKYAVTRNYLHPRFPENMACTTRATSPITVVIYAPDAAGLVLFITLGIRPSRF